MIGVRPNLSPPRVLVQGGGVIPFWKWEDEAKKCWERNFDFRPTAGENGACQKPRKGVRFLVHLIKVGNLGGLAKKNKT